MLAQMEGAPWVTASAHRVLQHGAVSAMAMALSAIHCTRKPPS